MTRDTLDGVVRRLGLRAASRWRSELEGYNEIYCISFDGSDLDDLVSFGGNPQGKLEDRAILCSVHFKLRRHLYEVRQAICWNGQNREHLRGEREGV
jgi:hypothetical protein